MLETHVKNASADSTYIEPMESMGERMKRTRTLKGLSLETVAEAIGISAQALSQWETGLTVNMRPENLLNWCAYFELNPYLVVFGKAPDKGSSGRFRRLTPSA